MKRQEFPSTDGETETKVPDVVQSTTTYHPQGSRESLLASRWNDEHVPLPVDNQTVAP